MDTAIMEKVYRYLQLVAVGLSVATPCVLLAGYVWYLGYIKAFGLDSSLMGRGFGESITESWYIGIRLIVYLTPKLWLPIIYTTAIAAIALVGLYAVVLFRAKGVDIVPPEITKENQGRTVLGLTLWLWMSWWKLLADLLHWIFWPAAALFLAYLVLVKPSQLGAKEAKRFIAEIQKRDCAGLEVSSSAVKCVRLISIAASESKVIAAGLLVSANNERLALFDGDKLEVWPLLDSYKIQRRYRSSESDAADAAPKLSPANVKTSPQTPAASRKAAAGS